jgi:hypothetical protein
MDTKPLQEALDILERCEPKTHETRMVRMKITEYLGSIEKVHKFRQNGKNITEIINL